MRKLPKQQRSRALVESLIDATAAVLAEHGLDNTTTNHIADAAGVSVGSLYQYFPDKESLIEALLERMVKDLTTAFNFQLDSQNLGELDLENLARIAIAIGLTTLRANPLYLELMQNWHRLPVMGPLDKLEQYMLNVARLYFLQHFQRYPVDNLQAKLYVLINSTLFTLARYLSQDNNALREQDILNALVDMISNTLGNK
ncbi:MAG: TetR/AcrR family transcriptional regulator [Gammaproteobacteria bacterium]|nr:TetR/AcrR family transcriptional regulator [Gammaproteobacteria bacterium]MBQ0773101.1 TetR/AcrR family transcriptional regulator [Gammaproteobacteria bacterium]